MDWAELLKDLKGRGWTQVLLASRLGVSQSMVSDLSRGEVKNPSFALGTALIALHQSGETIEAKAAA